MELLLENLFGICVFAAIAGIAFAAFIASPYDIQFDDMEDVEEF